MHPENGPPRSDPDAFCDPWREKFTVQAEDIARIIGVYGRIAVVCIALFQVSGFGI